jgi:hypothetical protein
MPPFSCVTSSVLHRYDYGVIKEFLQLCRACRFETLLPKQHTDGPDILRRCWRRDVALNTATETWQFDWSEQLMSSVYETGWMFVAATTLEKLEAIP